MRRFAAILLMGILFFNWYGYLLLNNYWQDRAGRSLEASLDKNDYDVSQLLSIKIPITTLSYYNSSTNYERVDGQIDVGGVDYKYVKRRIFKDSLEYLCIPNHMAMNLKNAKNEFFKLVNDLSHPGQDKKSPAQQYKSFSQDYCATQPAAFQPDAGMTIVQQKGMPAPAELPSLYAPTAEMPPDQAPVLS